MGYKKSFNLVTLQLIIPLSTMTKVEYKATYGIDLDDIDIERVTLLQEDGSKNKYFVDEVKTTENGVDIYAGGKILSIGSSVSVVNNAYSVDNAKPIYWHTIKIQRGGTTELQNVSRIFGYLIILNNKSESFTLADFMNMLKIPGVSIVLHSGLYSANGGANLLNMRNASRLVYNTDSTFNAEYINDEGLVTIDGNLSIDSGWTFFQDLGANKIN